ncbi:MAG TPA: diacylglycerol kinase family protein [Gemmatimonadales bacterium]|nr:diacylglycerol kinase family protein [Gemmatimonadales bacterium]
MEASARARSAAGSATIPAFVNLGGRRAKAAFELLERTPGFDVHLLEPGQLATSLRRAVHDGADRVLIAGGDGTIASAASVVARTPTALAVLPAGTLNHFARNHGIPTDLEEAIRVAATGVVKAVDVGYANDQLFLNTSSVGAYVRFVETRDRLEPYLGYPLASLAAGIRILRSLHDVAVKVEVGGETRIYRAPLVFIGMGERNLTPLKLGSPAGEAGRALHLIVPRGTRQARRFVRAYARSDRGLPLEQRPLGLDSALVQGFRLDLRKPMVKVATDGEIRRQRTPLEYRLVPKALNVIVPEA